MKKLKILQYVFQIYGLLPLKIIHKNNINSETLSIKLKKSNKKILYNSLLIITIIIFYSMTIKKNYSIIKK